MFTSEKRAATQLHTASASQQRTWFTELIAPGLPQHHLSFALEIFGELELAVLQLSLDVLTERQEALRTVFVDDGGVLRQAISGPRPIVRLVDAPAGPDPDLNSILQEQVTAPFDLGRGPLVRVVAVRRAPDVHVLVFMLHHIIADNLSLGLFAREIAETYAAFGRRTMPTLPALPWQYADFAAAEARWFASATFRYRLQLYAERLMAVNARLNLGAGDISNTGEIGANQLMSIDAAMVNRLKQVALRTGVTLFTVLLAAVESVLACYAEGENFVITVPVANRGSDGAEGVIGPFTNIVGLRAGIRAGQTMAELLADAGHRLLDALEYDSVPWDAVVRVVNPSRSADAAPLGQVMLSSIAAPAPFQHFGNLPCRPKWLPSPVPAFDLFVSATEAADGLLWLGFDYRRDKVAPHIVSRISGALRTVLSEIAHHDLATLEAYPKGKASGALSPDRDRDVAGDPSAKDFVRETAATPQRRYVLEKLTAQLWLDFLGKPPADMRQSFFDAGGDSLLAVRLMSTLSRRTDRKLPVALFFRDPTVDGLVTALMERNSGGEPDYAIIKLADGVDGRVLFVSSAQRGLAELAAAMPPGPSIYRLDAYFLQEQRLLAGKPMFDSIEAIAAEMRHRLKAVQPQGPYLLAGGCEGGVIFYELALQLQRDGDDVALLVQLDTPVRGIWESKSAVLGAMRAAKRRLLAFVVQPFQARTSEFERHHRIWAKIWLAVRSYHPRSRFNGDVHQFRAKPTIGIVDVASGWDERITGRLVVHDVSGDHLSWMDHPESAEAINAVLNSIMPAPAPAAYRNNHGD